MPKVKRPKVKADRDTIMRQVAYYPQLDEVSRNWTDLNPKQIIDRVHAHSPIIADRIIEDINLETQQANQHVHYRKGNILENHDVAAIVNPVNTAGTMGKGLALKFAKRYPSILTPYREACHASTITVKRAQIIEVNQEDNPRYVINLATKQHWRNPSQLQWINDGLDSMYAQFRQLGIASVAIPPLGAGLGGLPWEQVKALIEKHAQRRPHITTVIYQPH